MRSARLHDEVCRDVRYALRMCIRNRGFSALAILTLAIGIAGTTAMFALVHGVLLRPLPVPEQDRVIVAWREPGSSASARYPFGRAAVDLVRDGSHLFVGIAGVSKNGVGRAVIVENGVSNYVNDALVTGTFFDVLGVHPLLGRAITPGDDAEGTENVLVISSALWQRRYGASRQVLGRRVTLNSQRYTIVGVMPPDIDYPSGVEVWRTTTSAPTTGPFGDAARNEINLIGRLRPGVSTAQVASELATVIEELDRNPLPGVPTGLRPVVHSFEDVVVGDVRTSLIALFVAVGFVLLIASANAGNLLLMRGEARRGELAVRTALGATRGRIVRQVLVESLVLALAAAAVGLAGAWWSLEPLLRLVSGRLPRVASVHIDGTVVSFTIAIAVVTAVVAGFFPALLSLNVNLLTSLKNNAARGVAGPSARHGRQGLVVVQVALAVMIVASAGLVIRSVFRLQSVDLGLAPARLVMVSLDMPQAKYGERERRARFLDAAISELESIPGIPAVTPVNVPPFTGQGWDVPAFIAEGQSVERALANPSLNLESVHPNYFETFEVPLVRGRAFAAADRAGAPDVAIVSEDVASQVWPGADPIGKRLKMGSLPDLKPHWYTIVGVAVRTRYRDPTRPLPTLYLPAAQFQMTAEMLALRTGEPLDLIASLARDRIRAIDPDVNVMRVAPFTDMLDATLARPRFNAFLLSIFGIAALLLSAIGLYGVMAAFVRQRAREIAIRLALGATATGVRRFVLAEALWLAGLGAAIGLVGAVSSTRLLRGMLFEVDPLDPPAIAGAALLLILVSLLASYVPLRHATSVEATAMLRSD